MLIDGITNTPTGTIIGLKTSTGATFPTTPSDGDEFRLTAVVGAFVPGLYWYDASASTWNITGDITSVAAGAGLTGGGVAGALTLALDTAFIDSRYDSRYLAQAGGTLLGALLLSADPTQDLQAATKHYVDAVAQGLDPKASCRVATTANITLSGTQTIDGVAVVAGDRVLVKNQTVGSANGIYVVAAGAWVRSTDADQSTKVTAGMYTFIEDGTSQADTGWNLITKTVVLGTTALVFSQFASAFNLTAGSGIAINGNVISATALNYSAGAGVAIDGNGVISATGTTYTAGSGIAINAGSISIASLTSSLVTTALGYTPYNATTNTKGFVTGGVGPANRMLYSDGTGIATNSTFNFDTVTQTLSATNFAGAFKGNADSATSAAGLSATLVVGSGGTGVATLSGLAFGNGTNAMTAATAAQIVSAIGSTAVANATNATTATTATTAGSATTAAGLSATLVPASGGTGVATLTGLAYGNGTAAFTAATAAQIAATLGSTAVANATSAVNVSGIVGTANGGTGAATPAAALTALGALPVAGGTLTGPVLAAADPTQALGLATKQYVDAVTQGLDPKASVTVATTANITLSGLLTIDGITLTAGQRVLVKNQTTGSANGIYVAAAGAWTRAADAATSAMVTAGMYTFVEQGTTQAATGWNLTTVNPTLGTTALTFTQFGAAVSYTAGSGITLTGNVLSLTTPISAGTNVTVTAGVVAVSNAAIQAQITAGANVTVNAGVVAVPNSNFAYDVSGSCIGKPAASAVIMSFEAVRPFTIPASMTGSVAKCTTAATASTVLIVSKDGAQIGTITFAAGGTVGTFAAAAVTNMVSGSVLTVTAPATQDTTFANATITFLGQQA